MLIKYNYNDDLKNLKMFCKYCNNQYSSSSHLITKKHKNNIKKYDSKQINELQERLNDIPISKDIFGIILNYKIEMERDTELRSIIDLVSNHPLDSKSPFTNKFRLSQYYQDFDIINVFKEVIPNILCENDPRGKYVKFIDISYNHFSKKLYLVF